ncbi:MAG: diphthine synthase [Candidatus Nanoarchaeia archaeon]|nr:diphthine synthase [Candidatus Nanoarchaeia archaeon]MDD5357716.1 diphthine synthase [Candidatus Nanoarchaeia archaeon]MDD5588635.1 diphthine synthase [Candidatus Nanoarchaeia archaeon]
MIYLIGLGLNEKGISVEGIGALKKCKKIYLENYTVDFPYSFETLEKIIGKKIISADRDFVEDMKVLLNEAKEKNVALLIYGSPLTATTHISLIEEARRRNIKYEIIYGASVFDAIAETGLQIYKFGKITSMPKWQESFKPTSFVKIVKENQKVGAHSLILVDINLDLKNAIRELEESAKKERLKLGDIIICSRLGTKDKKIFYGGFNKMRSIEMKKPYCIIIPGKLHFIEEAVLKNLS